MRPGPKPLPNEKRFWKFVRKTKKCWLWIGALNNKGYGVFRVNNNDGTSRLELAHRFSFEIIRGKIPVNKILDHIECDNPPCVHPYHVELSAQRRNILRGNGIPAKNARKKECKNGHLFTEANTYWVKNWNGRKGRLCRTCRKKRSHERWKSRINKKSN